MTRRNVVGPWLAVAMMLLLLSAPTSAQVVESNASKLQVHGYLSQAYATSDHGQFLGIPDDGTSNYRTMALQFSYSMNDNENMTVQLAHEKQGKSPLGVYRDDIELDWAFYQRTFANGISAKVGRIQVPAGIYNEIRDVGVLLPFYRPDHNFYGDGAFSTETVDGLSFSRGGNLGDGGWSADADMFYGHSSVLVPSPGTGEAAVFEMETKDMFGGQLWLNSPIEGVRVGTSAMTTTGANLSSDNSDSRINVYRGSVEAALEKIQLRAEGSVSQWDDGKYKVWYAMATVPAGKFSLNAAYTTAHISVDVDIPFLGPLTLEDDWDKEYAFGVNYHHGFDLVMKLEHHRNEGYNIDGVGYQAFPSSPGESEYTIMSLSKAF